MKLTTTKIVTKMVSFKIQNYFTPARREYTISPTPHMYVYYKLLAYLHP